MSATPQQYENVFTTCPVCDRPAVYLFNPDRYFHRDGTDNKPCWRRIAAGYDHGRVERAVPLHSGTTVANLRRSRRTVNGKPWPNQVAIVRGTGRSTRRDTITP